MGLAFKNDLVMSYTFDYKFDDKDIQFIRNVYGAMEPISAIKVIRIMAPKLSLKDAYKVMEDICKK